jgi:hypothetical protein
MIYDQRKTNIGETLIEFNKQQANIRFTIEKEQHKSMNFLDLTITPWENKTRICNIKKTQANRYHNT